MSVLKIKWIAPLEFKSSFFLCLLLVLCAWTCLCACMHYVCACMPVVRMLEILHDEYYSFLCIFMNIMLENICILSCFIKFLYSWSFGTFSPYLSGTFYNWFVMSDFFGGARVNFDRLSCHILDWSDDIGAVCPLVAVPDDLSSSSEPHILKGQTWLLKNYFRTYDLGGIKLNSEQNHITL